MALTTLERLKGALAGAQGAKARWGRRFTAEVEFAEGLLQAPSGQGEGLAPTHRQGHDRRRGRHRRRRHRRPGAGRHRRRGRPGPHRQGRQDLHHPLRRPRPHRHELALGLAGDRGRHQRHLQHRAEADGRVRRLLLQPEPGVGLRHRPALQPRDVRPHPRPRRRGPLGGHGRPLGRGRQEPRRRREPGPPPALHPPLHAGAPGPGRGRADARLGAGHLRPRRTPSPASSAAAACGATTCAAAAPTRSRPSSGGRGRTARACSSTWRPPGTTAASTRATPARWSPSARRRGCGTGSTSSASATTAAARRAATCCAAASWTPGPSSRTTAWAPPASSTTSWRPRATGGPSSTAS